MWKCETCGLYFTEPLWIPRYVDDIRPVISAYSDPVCPFCLSENIEEVIDIGEDEEE